MSKYAIMPAKWTEHNRAMVKHNRASYFTKRNVKGYRVLKDGRQVEKFYRLSDAKQWVKEQVS